APMKTFPIIRDLVTDVSFNYEVAKTIPAFKPGPEPEGGYRMMQVDVERGQEFRKCIECFMCQDVCHVIRDHEENKPKYAGPRFFIRFAELEMHPLDVNDRRELAHDRGLGMCNITKCCTEVCPEHIKITDNGIIPLKERVVDSRYDPVAWLGRKVLGRKVGPLPPEDTGPSPIHRPPQPVAYGVPANAGLAAHAGAPVAGAPVADGYWGPPGQAEGSGAAPAATAPVVHPQKTAENEGQAPTPD
ncbi:MAG: succinate dehydrogenase/fumarate reductase iron-sulfur subunit, partial [Acidimicrobiales bacterium]